MASGERPKSFGFTNSPDGAEGGTEPAGAIADVRSHLQYETGQSGTHAVLVPGARTLQHVHAVLGCALNQPWLVTFEIIDVRTDRVCDHTSLRIGLQQFARLSDGRS